MRLLAYSLLLISSHAFAGSTIDPPSAPDAGTLRGNVLVWHDAMLYAEASDTASSIQLATIDGARKDHLGHVLALKVVGTKGAFVEVELTGQQDCAPSRVVVPDDLARVRLFVRRADLAPVLVKSVTQSFDDGTSISLAPGTPVLPTDAGTYVVSLRSDALEVEVPSASVGFAYGVGKSRVSVMQGQTSAIAAATKVTLGARTLALTAWQGAPIERRGDSTLVALDGGCVSAHVLVPSKALADADESTGDLSASNDGNDVVSLRDECFLPKLTPLAIGSKQVALAAKPIYLHAEPMGKNACIQRALRIESTLEIKSTDEKLRLCAPATKVLHEQLRSARSAPR
ncbi:MAG TPA: hypothetical protein VFV99_15370 [Kofleriaceae bacterium]|nr:hypothetical protein [Kofleriaceae bacterium]